MANKPPPPKTSKAPPAPPVKKVYAKGDGMTTDKPRLPGETEMPDAFRPGLFPQFRLTPVGTLPPRAIPAPPKKAAAPKKPRR